MIPSMDIHEKTLQLIKTKKLVKSSEIAVYFKISRQYAAQLLTILVNAGKIVKIGSTRNARYTLPQFADELGSGRSKQRLQNNKDLKEHEVVENFLKIFPAFRLAPENIRSIVWYGFSEMLNNAMEHSRSPHIEVEIIHDESHLRFIVNDFGIGVFRNVMEKQNLKSEFEAMQDLLKGRTTTHPQAHSGEGIFFTSKAADRFILESFGRRMVVDNIIHDIFFEEQKPSKRGTRVIFSISKASKRHLNDVFRRFQSDPEQSAFDRTEIHVRLFTMGTIYVSRSQARRILSGLEKFKSVILDFNRVSTIGQAFADEIFRVFKIRYPAISIDPVNMNEAVRFMIERVEKS